MNANDARVKSEENKAKLYEQQMERARELVPTYYESCLRHVQCAVDDGQEFTAVTLPKGPYLDCLVALLCQRLRQMDYCVGIGRTDNILEISW